MRFNIWTVGCQMNVADSERMAAALESMGGTPVRRVQEADVVVLNTCSVRQAAEDRALGKLAALNGLKRRRPEMIIALAGCMVGEDSLSELQKKLPFVDAFIRPADVKALRETVRFLSPAGSSIADSRIRASTLQIESSAETKTRSTLDGVLWRPGEEPEPVSPVRYVPVIHGCNRSCSYCIVPARRGREHSRTIDEIESEVRGLVARGAREVRLLGQIVDRYGWDLPDETDLAGLFARLGEIEDLHRIRFLTSHPRDLRETVIAAVANEPKVCEDVNLPVQSGDDLILKSMRRGYTVGFYRELIHHMRSVIRGLALSTDVIVGYPGEEEPQFQRTLNLLEELRFDVVHVAMYSPRHGTTSAEMPDDVPPEAKKERLRRVEELQTAIVTERNSLLMGQTVEILVEGQQKGKWEGRTPANKVVFFIDEQDWLGRLAQVRIERTGPWSLTGRLATTSSSTTVATMSPG